MIKEYFVLALKNLKRRGIRSWLTMLGIFLGIAALVSLISLGNGLQDAITGQFNSLSIDSLVVTNADVGFSPPGSTAIEKLKKHDLDLIKEIDGVKTAIPRLLRIVKLEHNKNVRFEFVASIPNNEKEAQIVYTSFNLKPDQGRSLKSEDRGKIVLGSNFLREHYSEKQIRTGSKLIIQEKEFEVIGILKQSSSFQINSVVLMLEDDLKDLLDIKDEIDLIAVKVDNPNKIKDVAEKIKKTLRKDRNLKEGEEDFSVETPLQSINSVNTILSVINIVISSIAGLSLFIGGIGIANTMYTSVLERTKEIGIMKSIGAKQKDILSIFLIESGLLGLIGGIIGTIIGLALAFGLSFLVNSNLGNFDLKVSLSIPLIIGAILFSFIIGIISGVTPAIQASKLKPVEALRK